MTESPFELVYEIDAHHASTLAQAFISAKSEDEFWAVLRFADARDDKEGGFYGSYIQGCHFEDYTDRNGDFTPSGFTALRDSAWKYRDESPGQFWKLAV